MRVNEIITDIDEGIYDPHIFKAVFMAGGPGSGKSYIAKSRILKGGGLKIVNSDDVFEFKMKKAGLDYVILEKGTLANSIFNYPVNMTFFSSSERLEMANIPFMSVGSKPTRTEALEYYRRIFSHFDLKLNLYEEVETLSKAGDMFQIKTSKSSYQTKKIVMATGFYDLPNLMNVPGEDAPKSCIITRSLGHLSGKRYWLSVEQIQP
jgi:hypothetical protein